jgi:hypothetical protein
MGPDGSIWVQMAPYWSIWFPIEQYGHGSELSLLMGLYGFLLVQMDPDSYLWVQMAP